MKESLWVLKAKFTARQLDPGTAQHCTYTLMLVLVSRWTVVPNGHHILVLTCCSETTLLHWVVLSNKL